MTLDPAIPCVDRLTTVYPSVTSTRYEPPRKCYRLKAARAANACVMGYRGAKPAHQFALIGDSHTQAWSVALGDLGARKRWRVTVFEGPGCFMSGAAYEMLPVQRTLCVRAVKQTDAWLKAHPQIDTIFTAEEVDKGLPGSPKTIESRKRRAFEHTFKAYPRTVKRVIVLRDTPNIVQPQYDCLAAAVRAGVAPAGPQCPLARHQALLVPDAAAVAAQALHAARYRVIDLTDLMCSPTLCFPALGGVLVNLDLAGHMTFSFARTLEPELLERLTPLLP